MVESLFDQYDQPQEDKEPIEDKTAIESKCMNCRER